MIRNTAQDPFLPELLRRGKARGAQLDAQTRETLANELHETRLVLA